MGMLGDNAHTGATIYKGLSLKSKIIWIMEILSIYVKYLMIN